METEIPAMLLARQHVFPERFTFHSSRMRMKHVTKHELEAMDRESLRCAAELSDARVDVVGYACLVAIMSMGLSYHRRSSEQLAAVAKNEGAHAPVITSAGALISSLHSLNLKRIALIMRPLAEMVVRYVENEGIEVVDWLALEIPDNLAVGRRDPMALLDDLKRINARDAQGVVLSACVQMPSLEAIPTAERLLGKPVVSAATCTVREMLLALGLTARAPDCGAALA
jgi:maleate isomerase